MLRQVNKLWGYNRSSFVRCEIANKSANHMAVMIAIAVVEHAGRFLIGRRPAGVPLAGMWEFPGGKVEPGESPAAAAVRECREETGLPVEVLEEYPSHRQAYDHAEVQLHFFHCRPLETQPTIAAAYRWVERAELANYEFPAGNRELLQMLREQ